MEENTATKLATLEADVSGLKGDIKSLGGEVEKVATKLDSSLGRLFDKIESANRRPFPWTIVLAFAAVAATVILALSSWANAYFGQAISAAQREAILAQEAHNRLQVQISTQADRMLAQAIEAARLDERQKFTMQEVDRLRGQSQPRQSNANESPP